MEFKKLSNWEKWYLKYTNRKVYHQYKHWLIEQRLSNQFFERGRSVDFKPVHHPYKTRTSFKHSGNSGDIIYSLPTIYELAKAGTATLLLAIDQPADYKQAYHPLGDIMLNRKMAEMLIPLLRYQPQIGEARIYHNEPVDYDLDEFRSYGFHLDRGSIVRWYYNVYAISPNTALPWLTAPVDPQYKNGLVIARSHRYRSPMVDYSFLNQYPDKFFLGVPEEYEDMKKTLPGLVYKPVTDFLEMATVINSCKLFIGNQSFPYAIAEALKSRRLLEVYFNAPNVVVEGDRGGDFMYQPQFEYAVQRMLGADCGS